MSPFGGPEELVEFWRELGLLAAVRERLPFSYTSPNSIFVAETLLAFWLRVTTGARRFAHGKLVTGLRVSAEEETEGLDLGAHGSEAYPDFHRAG